MEVMVNQVFLFFQVFSKLVQDLTLFCFLCVTLKDEPKADLINDVSILLQTTSQLKQHLILVIVLVGGSKYAADPSINQPLQRASEECGRI
jgi:hypothetical protein